MVAQIAFTGLLLTLASVALAERTLNYNVGGPPIGKFCGDPVAFLVSTNSSFEYINRPKVKSLGPLASHRSLSSESNKFEFRFPVPAGKYRVVLGFAEVWPGAFAIGKRQFDYSIQDTLFFRRFDTFKGVGADNPLWRTTRNVAVGTDGLKLSFIRGASQSPMVSVIEITSENGKDMNYPPGSVCRRPPPNPNTVSTPTPTSPPPPCGVTKLKDTSMTGGSNHQAHAVPGEGYVKTDFNGDGKVSVLLDGTKSHSHYFNPETKMAAKIDEYIWSVNGKVIGKRAQLQATFPVGKTIVTLTVRDNLNDVACANTEVIGLPASDNGAYCYFYPRLTKVNPPLNTDPKPQQGVKVENINWATAGSFPFIGKSGKVWTVRCLANLKVGAISGGAIQLKRMGRVALYVNDKALIAEGPGKGGKGVVKVGRSFPAGTIPLNIVYHKAGADAQLVLQLNGVPVKQSQLLFSRNEIIPVLKSIFPTKARISGGDQMQLYGNGFFNSPKVYVGRAKPDVTVVSTSELMITIPSQAQAGSAIPKVYVGNKAGESNNILLPYEHSKFKCENPIKWKKTFLKDDKGKKLIIDLVTSVAVGPDFNYYMGSQLGTVHKVSVNRDLVVTSRCTSKSLGRSRSVLGIAFNPRKKAPQPYVTTSTLSRNDVRKNTPLLNKVDGWANGKVETLTVGCGCFCKPKDIVTGLPVSEKDHAVNKILFLPNGDMLLTVGGATNAGHDTPISKSSKNSFFGLGETVLSASILLVKTSKGDDIDGKVTYDQYKTPEKAKKMSGEDVMVYASGVRNSFGICRTVNGKVYATDNSGNENFGMKSTGCNSQVPFGKSIKDELNLIDMGNHYGHANRAQGKCVWGTGVKPITTFKSSTNGLIQYQSNAFCGDLKFDILSGQFVPSGNEGRTNRIILNSDGTFNRKYVLAKYSGVAIENGLYGEVILPRVYQSMVAVLQPRYEAPDGPFVVSCTPKMGRKNQIIFVTGNNFKAGLIATMGGKPCARIKVLSSFAFTCVTPPGKGLVSISVQNPDGKTMPAISAPGDFSYI